jgi:hypothetical protein
MTLFSRLTRDYDSNEVLIILENLPFYRNSTMTVKELKSLAAKLLTIADEASKGDTGEFKNGNMEQYYQVCDYESTLEYQDNEENFQDLDE